MSSETTRKPAAGPRIEISAPGQWTPSPSPTQNVPKLPIRTPTASFSVVLGHPRERSAQGHTGNRDHEARRRGRQAGRNHHVGGGSNRQHDEHNLEPLEHHSLESGHDRDGVPPNGLALVRA